MFLHLQPHNLSMGMSPVYGNKLGTKAGHINFNWTLRSINLGLNSIHSLFNFVRKIVFPRFGQLLRIFLTDLLISLRLYENSVVQARYFSLRIKHNHSRIIAARPLG